MRDLYNTVDVLEALETIVVNNDTEGKGAAVDLKGYNSCVLAVAVGQSGDTLSGSVKLALRLQHSDTTTDGDFADVGAGDIIGAASATFATVDEDGEDGAVYSAGYVGSKRYVRVFVDTTGTHTQGTPIGAVAILGRERHTGGQAV